MASPNPFPPYFLEFDDSTCLNRSNISLLYSSGMPIPVSLTRNWIKSPVVSIPSSTYPSLVNLMALPTRLTKTCFKRLSSLLIQRSSFGFSGSILSSTPFPWATIEYSRRSPEIRFCVTNGNLLTIT